MSTITSTTPRPTTTRRLYTVPTRAPTTRAPTTTRAPITTRAPTTTPMPTPNVFESKIEILEKKL